jgi:hypothetical protein
MKAIAGSFCLMLLVTGPISPAHGQSALTTSPSQALDAYDKALSDFKSILRERRVQINSREKLPDRPGQALYLARNKMMSAYKDLTDVSPAKIGRPNKFGIPPAYFDADNEPLLDEYTNLFAVMQAAPANAQSSGAPFDDVVALGIVIAKAKGLDAASAEVAGRLSLGIFFAETNGNQNIGNARSNKYKGSMQTGVSEDQNGQRKWAAIKTRIAALDPALSARDDKEEARLGHLDRRFNHWTAVRDGLMNRARRAFPANTGNRARTAEPDRSDESLRAHPDYSEPHQVRPQIRQPGGIQNLRLDDNGISAQQQRLHLWTCGPGKSVCNLPRSPRRDVAVQRQVRTGARQIQRNQGPAIVAVAAAPVCAAKVGLFRLH